MVKTPLLLLQPPSPPAPSCIPETQYCTSWAMPCKAQLRFYPPDLGALERARRRCRSHRWHTSSQAGTATAAPAIVAG